MEMQCYLTLTRHIYESELYMQSKVKVHRLYQLFFVMQSRLNTFSVSRHLAPPTSSVLRARTQHMGGEIAFYGARRAAHISTCVSVSLGPSCKQIRHFLPCERPDPSGL